MSKTKADPASDIYGTPRENPYVQRLMEDDELRDNLRDAFESAKKAYTRATGNGRGPVNAVTSDKKTQKELRRAAEKLKDANERLQKPRKKSKLGRLILLAVVGGIVALVVSEGARKA